ncbi:1-deoxy-D-xylulose-5-phosphate synthase [Lentzea waywayandensis]|uniref:1-deoxy-D-xylulose-5-phosphate synthase n=1 Tax=Lentzea waywayandensis TaxID=84724 RepID=A0A1I6FJQ6_9PSEU|nr:1-deoxy-D-xylulose-5-phosphate synthase [Lentzea waywayandensis]SFR30170.1 1-deoxy-D-xylulose-5-phosphate synthase [Lentzea waywayandensis]
MIEEQIATHSSGWLRQLGSDELCALAAEIREFLITSVCAQGGHLGSNLGVVELTIALHRVFTSPKDRILFDTGHQAYVHKILTGRQHRFSTLRIRGGLSGYPSQAESVHDMIENSHASTALSYADGLSRADELTGKGERSVVAVVGDGALTGGMCWEALNNIGVSGRPIVVVLNDNERSYGPTLGGFAEHLRDLRTPGRVTPIFEQLGLAYLGPVDGHDLPMVERAMRQARAMRRPVVVHCLTLKGKGYPHAETDDADRMHAIGATDPVTGVAAAAARPTWTDVFGEEIVAIGTERPDVVCLTAAMLLPTGLGRFAKSFPDRVVDAGIAEQHVITTAAGLALGGCHPVVAVYSTFLNRAFDQVVMDVALHRLPVTFVLDRAGVTGPDGPSHHGVWDVSMLAAVPGLRAAAPRDPRRLRELLREAVSVTSGPTVVRFPKSVADGEIEAVGHVDGVDVLHRTPHEDVLLVSMGPTAAICLDAARELSDSGIGVTVVDPRWILPLPRAVVTMAGRHRLVLTVEDAVRTGGAGSILAQAVIDAGGTVPVHNLGFPRRFLPHASRQEVLREHGFTGSAIAAAVRAGLAGEPVYDQDPDLPSRWS